MIQVLRFAMFRARTGRRLRLAGYLSVVLLIGLVGGVAMAAIAGARRTEASFPTYVASTNPSTVGVFTMYRDPGLGLNAGYVPSLIAKVHRLALVTRAADAIIFDGNIDIGSITGANPHPSAGESPPTIIGSPNGELASMDRMTVVAGRALGADDVNAAVINAQAARQMGIHVGCVLRFPFYSNAELASPLNFPPRWITVTIVGEVASSRDVIESDIAALNSARVIFSPALTRELEDRYSTGTETFLQTVGGDRTARRVLAEVLGIDPVTAHFPAQVTSSFVPVAQQAITPEAIALGVFGGISGLSALLIAGLMIAREVRARGDDLDSLRAVGADRLMLLGDEVIGLLGALLVGALLAVGVAVSLSPLAPLGPVRPVYPGRGFATDWTVLGVGLLAIVVVLGIVAVLASLREIRQHEVGLLHPVSREPRWSRVTTALSLPVSAETGVRFATEGGRVRNAAPVRSAMLGSVLAVTVLVASVTFGASLNNLVSHPALYGWNWNYALLSSFAGAEDLPGPQVSALLNRDHSIEAWSGINLATAKLDGQRVQILTERPGSVVAPPVLSGHGVTAANQIDLGPTTLSLLHKRVGETITLSNGVSKPMQLVIVGTVTMPALSQSDGEGTGAVAATSDFPPALLNLQDATIPGPNAVLVRLRSGVAPGVGLQSLEAINAAVNRLAVSSGLGGGVIGPLRPVEIVNFRSMGTTPAILAAGLSLGAIVALGLTLSASVRRRRRELALLKAMGFSRRQLFASVAWQATAAASVGIVVGIPLGVVIGRQLWFAFARSISVVPDAIAPLTTLIVIAAGALVFANLVALLPGRIAARTSTAIVLRSE